ncbi:unnamed protein product [Closterium sp. NIES-64]|nr:unnamed protein product [Closterium sp. NIES-64]
MRSCIIRDTPTLPTIPAPPIPASPSLPPHPCLADNAVTIGQPTSHGVISILSAPYLSSPPLSTLLPLLSIPILPSPPFSPLSIPLHPSPSLRCFLVSLFNTDSTRENGAANRGRATGKTVAIKKIHLGDCKEGVNVTALREIKLLHCTPLPSPSPAYSVPHSSPCFPTFHASLVWQTGRTVAIKKIHLGDCKEGVNVTALREIKLLQELHHPHIIDLIDIYPHKRNLNLVLEFMETDLEEVEGDEAAAGAALHHPHIINLIDIYPHKRNLNLVLEFMETDLENIIKDRSLHLSPADVKAFMRMTLEGLAYLHGKWVLHRLVPPLVLLPHTGL